MGCGAVCGNQNINSIKHNNYSKIALQQLSRHITINPPLLPQTTFIKFSNFLQQLDPVYILKVNPTVSSEEDISASIQQKWKIVLYGLFKSDETYNRCLGFQLRNEKYQITTSQNTTDNNRLLRNDSYHQAKEPTHFHSCFTQIQKDLNRTFDFKQETKQRFQKVLKRISNHFPTMGYTQGVNFVVGYLLILGYSQADTFWMFSHLAINRKYLLLGLYQDGFPLATVYTLLFKNLLKRYDLQLYNHIYNTLMLDQSIWIFKWFITYFIYSFPLQTIKFVWDLVIQLGGVALVFYALAIVLKLKSHLISIQDPCDVSQFLQTLKNLTVFNELLKINEVVQFSYEITLIKSDFKGIQNLQNSFYKEYYLMIQTSLQQQKINKRKNQSDSTTDTVFINNKSITDRLHTWYNNLIHQRNLFTGKPQKQKNKLIVVPQLLKNDYQELEKSIQILQDKFIQNQSIKLSQKTIREKQFQNQYQNQNQIYIQSNTKYLHPEAQLINNYVKPSEFDTKYKIITKLSYDIQEEIDELQGESDSNNCDQLQESQHLREIAIEDIPSKQNSINIEIQQKSERNNIENIQLSFLIGQLENCRKKVAKQYCSKANNICISSVDTKNGLRLAGQQILNNLSNTNSQYSSGQSKKGGFKPKKHKQNNISRYNLKNNKAKTQAMSQNSHPSNSSQRESSIDRQTEKDSLSGFTHRQNLKKQKQIFNKDNCYLQRKTQQELMMTSHCPDPKKQTQSKQMVSEIQIFHGEGIFKKKKRIYNRNSIVTSIAHENRDDKLTNYQPGRSQNQTYHEQQSLESIIQLSTYRGRREVLNPKEEMLYQIESVK